MPPLAAEPCWDAVDAKRCGVVIEEVVDVSRAIEAKEIIAAFLLEE